MAGPANRVPPARWEPLANRLNGLLPPDALHTIERIDPYLVWADATAFDDFATDGQTIERVPAVIELCPGVERTHLPKWAAKLTRRPTPAKSRYLTGKVDAVFLSALQKGEALSGLVRRVEMCLPVAAPRDSIAGDPSPLEIAGFFPLQVLLGVIDNGCAFAHRSMRLPVEPKKTRVIALWDQNEENGGRQIDIPGRRPPEFGYGKEIDRAALNTRIAEYTVGPRRGPNGGP